MNWQVSMKTMFLSIAFSGTSVAIGQNVENKQLIAVEQPAVTSGQGHGWAVVIGVNEYLDPNFPSLRYSVNDARLVERTLTEHCGFENRVLLLTGNQPGGPHTRPTRKNIQNRVPDWLKQAQPEDTVIVFFSGHGFLDPRGQGYLATEECEKGSPGLTALRTDDLRENFYGSARLRGSCSCSTAATPEERRMRARRGRRRRNSERRSA